MAKLDDIKWGSTGGLQEATPVRIKQNGYTTADGTNNTMPEYPILQWENYWRSMVYQSLNKMLDGDKVAIGRNAGDDTQGASSIAVGLSAGQTNQGGLSVAVGKQAGETSQGARSSAIGVSSGQTNQGEYSVAVGAFSGQTNQGGNGVIISAKGSAVNDTTDGHIHISSDVASLDYTSAAGWSTSGGKLKVNGDLEVTGSLPAAQVPSSSTAIGGGQNLNNFITAGFYHQTSNAGAASGSNYPVDYAGSLLVEKNAGVTQTYKTYGSYNTTYTRGFYSNTWSSWKRVTTFDSSGNITANQLLQTGHKVRLGEFAGEVSQGTNSVAIGYRAGSDTQERDAIAIGREAGNVNQDGDSIAIGREAGNNNQGGISIAIGPEAAKLKQSTYSVALGCRAAKENQSSNSIAIGYEAGREWQGSNSVALGYCAGQRDQGNNSVAIGSFADQYSQPANSICISAGTSHASNTKEKQIVIGSYDFEVRIGDGNVRVVSDERDKYDIIDSPLGLDFINALKPKFYKYDIRALYEGFDEDGKYTRGTPDGSKAGKRYHSGFIAQEVHQVMQDFDIDFGVYRDDSVGADEKHKEMAEDKLGLCYMEFIAIQSKAIQELSAKVDSLSETVQDLKQRLDS